jgi:hypothetical protein
MEQVERDIEEYKALRAEVVAAVNATLTTTNYLLVGLGALVASGIAALSKKTTTT